MKRNLYKLLGKAISIATEAHAGQFDKGGRPYILHPLHLMNQLSYDVELMIIAVLHDVVEDSDWTIGGLRNEGFTKRVVSAVARLTHRPDDSYDHYIFRVGTNYDALRVKRKDLEHNSCITRLKGVTSKDLERAEKYHKAFMYLGEQREKFL